MQHQQQSHDYYSLHGHDSPVTSICSSTDLLVVSTSTDGVMQLWSLQDTTEPRSCSTMRIACGITSALFFSRSIAATAGDGCLHMFDIVSGTHRRVCQRGDVSVVNDVATDGELVGFGGDGGSLLFCDPRSRQIARETKFGAPITSLANDGGRWFCGLANGSIYETNSSGQTQALHTHNQVISGLTALSGRLFSRDIGGTAAVWDTKPFSLASRLILKFTLDQPSSCPLLPRAVGCPDGVLVGLGDGSCELFDETGGRKWRKQTFHEGFVSKVIALGDGRLVSAGWDKNVHVFHE